MTQSVLKLSKSHLQANFDDLPNLRTLSVFCDKPDVNGDQVYFKLEDYGLVGGEPNDVVACIAVRSPKLSDILVLDHCSFDRMSLPIPENIGVPNPWRNKRDVLIQHQIMKLSALERLVEYFVLNRWLEIFLLACLN